MNFKGKQELLKRDIGVRERGNFGLRSWNHRAPLCDLGKWERNKSGEVQCSGHSKVWEACSGYSLVQSGHVTLPEQMRLG